MGDGGRRIASLTVATAAARENGRTWKRLLDCLNRERNEAVVLRYVPLEDVRAQSKHSLEPERAKFHLSVNSRKERIGIGN